MVAVTVVKFKDSTEPTAVAICSCMQTDGRHQVADELHRRPVVGSLTLEEFKRKYPPCVHVEMMGKRLSLLPQSSPTRTWLQNAMDAAAEAQEEEEEDYRKFALRVVCSRCNPNSSLMQLRVRAWVEFLKKKNIYINININLKNRIPPWSLSRIWACSLSKALSLQSHVHLVRRICSAASWWLSR